MLEIRIDNEALDLPGGFSVELEDTNPIFNERGSQSVPATVPATRVNERLLDFPGRIDTGRDPNRPERVAVVSDGAYVRRGMVNVTSAGRAEGITFNIGFDNSTAYNRWSDKKLSELATLPTVRGEDVGVDNNVIGMISYLSTMYMGAVPSRDPLAVFPLAVGKESVQADEVTTAYWEVLNAPQSTGYLRTPTTVNRVIDGQVTAVTVPEGYAISPFLRVWRLLELVFEDLGVTIENNGFRTDPELARLVVLNNAADAVCTGELRYMDLVPDCTVSEFLTALWVRFGLTYNINYDTKSATLRFLRDIITSPDSREITDITTGPELINYEARQYVKLSAKTSLEGAAPATERFEDFIRGLDVGAVHMGADVSGWRLVADSAGDGHWDGDIREDYWEPDDPDYPDPDPQEPDYPDPADRDDERDDRDDTREDDRDEGRDDYSRAAAPAAKAAAKKADTFLAREFVTGTWYKLDTKNGKVRESSSGFFNWDPATPDLDALDLSSADECVPIVRVDTMEAGTGNLFRGKCPAYLTGARHYHSYIKGSEDAKDTGETTPLAFAIAYTFGRRTIGRINPEGDDGQPLRMDDGSRPSLSLLFQFKDGLFAKFWAGYDEILRHGNRSVEVPARIDKRDLLRLDILSPVVFRGVRCLFDTLTYQLPAGKEIRTNLKLRTISMHGAYDIRQEQNVPDFSTAARHLEWFLKSETYSESMLTDRENMRAAVNKYRTDTAYEPHGEDGDYYDLRTDSAVPVSIGRIGLTWQNDTSKPTPKYAGARNGRKYKALLTYYIHEIHDMSYQGGPEDWELDEAPLGQVSVTVEYSVELVARWVSD